MTLFNRFLVLLAGLLVPLTITQCVVVEEGAYTGPHRSSYDLGVEKGRADGSGGRSRTPSRHYGSFPAAETAAFDQGYEDGYNEGIKPGAGTGNVGFGQPLTAETGQGSVTIKEGGSTVSVCYTVSPNIEKTRFIDEQNQIVIKSRGNHGPATVQLFDTRTGKEQDRIMAFAIQGGEPGWASGMGD